jgi:hypothetical protein
LRIFPKSSYSPLVDSTTPKGHAEVANLVTCLTEAKDPGAGVNLDQRAFRRTGVARQICLGPGGASHQNRGVAAAECGYGEKRAVAHGWESCVLPL